MKSHTEVRSKNLTVVIPVLDEEDLIETTVDQILLSAREVLDKFEIIIVNDGSQDRTEEIIDRLAAQNPEIHPIDHPYTMGIGYSIHEGIRLASYDHFIGLPGDNAYPKNTIISMFKEIGAADYVVGYRKNKHKNHPLYRYLISDVLVWIVSLLSGRWPILRDYSSPAIYPVNVLRKLNLVETGYGFQIEMTVKLLRTGVTLKEIPVDMNPSQGNNTSAIKFSTLWAVLRVLWHLIWSRE